ncbi:MAG: hypothetical protein RLZZ338_2978 [Cyanobacteriota bacterium]
MLKSQNSPEWVLETNSFKLLEYAPKPRTLSTKLVYKETGKYWAFSSLGIDRERFEKCDLKVLDSIFFLLANYLIGLEANCSICSVWANLPYAFPTAEELYQFEHEEIETLKAIAIFIDYGQNLF